MKLSKVRVGFVSLALVVTSSGCGNAAATKDSPSSTAKSLEKAAGASIGDAEPKNDSGKNKPAASGDASSRVESGAKAGRSDDALGEEDDLKTNRIFFETIHTIPENPKLVRPCIKIRSALYKKAQNGKDFEVDFSFSYQSRGETVTKTITVKLVDMSPEALESDHMVEDPNGGKKKEKYIELMANVDISDHPIDADPRFTGTAKLFKNKAPNPRVDAGSAPFTPPTTPQ